MALILTADVGSTFTKLTAVDSAERRVIGSARAFTTIETRVMDGFEAARRELFARFGAMEFDRLVAASSAAGGLKMVSVGLVPDLTVQAARLAAANAGAKILKAYSYELSQDEITEIVSLGPDMVLLSGGADGGNKAVIIHNAKALAASGLSCSMVVAGNKSAVDEVRTTLRGYPGEVIFTANVMPEVNQLNIAPAQKAIRDLFIRHIISAKGLNELQALCDAEIIPTPLAVFEAASLLAKGTRTTPGLGDLLVFDVGGATTDVYSMSDGLPTKANVFLTGMRQPWAKRTVEGDLGLRYSLVPLLEAAGLEDTAAGLGLEYEEVSGWLEVCRLTPEVLPETGTNERGIDEFLTGEAVRLSLARHVGSIETVYTIAGQAFAQTGKDLSNTGLVIGTGGPIIGSQAPARVLAGAVWSPRDVNLLKPLSPKLAVDQQYIMSAMGLLSRLDPEAALAILKEAISAGAVE